MTITYDPESWLLSATRSLGDYVTTTLDDPDTDVEMSFPDTRSWPKQVPLAKALVHFEQDGLDNPILGFGSPGDDILDDSDPLNPTLLHREAAMHDLNFDVGIWVSAECGGTTKRMELMQVLANMFTTSLGKKALNAATEGLTVMSFNGGRFEIDRINDIPVWRALDMTLIVRCFSRHIPAVPDVVALDIYQDQDLTIRSESGADISADTP